MYNYKYINFSITLKAAWKGAIWKPEMVSLGHRTKSAIPRNVQQMSVLEQKNKSTFDYYCQLSRYNTTFTLFVWSTFNTRIYFVYILCECAAVTSSVLDSSCTSSKCKWSMYSITNRWNWFVTVIHLQLSAFLSHILKPAHPMSCPIGNLPTKEKPSVSV